MNVHEFINIIKSTSRELTNSELEKKVIRVYNPISENDIGCIINYVMELNQYEVYMFVSEDKENITSNLLTKLFDNENDSIKYFEILSKHIENKDFDSLVKLIDNE